MKILISVLILLLLLVACNAPQEDREIRADAPDSALTVLRASLAEGNAPLRQQPFGKRDFQPSIDGRGLKNAVAYGCYREGQAPWGPGPSDAEIREDLAIIVKHWSLIRLYNADDDTERILSAIADEPFDLRVMLGVWLENETDKPEIRGHNIDNVLRGIELANRYPDIVVAVNVGNETQVDWSAHRMAQADLIRYIRAVRDHVPQPITTADDYNFWNKPNSREVAREVDFIVTHAHPLWNGKTLTEAIPWLEKTLATLSRMHPDHRLVLGETGWATRYNADKVGSGQQGTLIRGDVSEAAQGRFLIALDDWIARQSGIVFLFEAFDESWKGGACQTGPEEVEKNWGVFYEDRTPKPSFETFISDKKQMNQEVENE